MSRLTDAEKKRLCALIQADQPLPAPYKGRLLAPEEGTFIQATKEYRLVYEGKTRREEVIANTPEAPFQIVRSFNTDNPFPDGWRNMLIYGDNLLALKELYTDQRGPNRYRTRDRIKLIYIDPPFATRQDFLKDKEKAYRDKVIGAQFIEFLRKRLILLHEVLAGDGSIYVHLDWKKCHYAKAVLDEVFGEDNFQNEIVWYYYNKFQGNINRFASNHDVVFCYTKGDEYTFHRQREKRQDVVRQIRRAWDKEKGAIVNVKGADGKVLYQEVAERTIDDVWRIPMLQPADRTQRTEYPTQKPEALLERIIRASSNEEDIVLDAFAGSGTAPGVAEKLGRRWIAMDCGKLALYTMQKRLMTLTNIVGNPKSDDRNELERVTHFDLHLSSVPGVLLVTEAARKGECDVTLELLADLADLIKKQDLARKGAPFSLICPEEKLKVPESRLEEPDEASGAGQKRIRVKGVEFRVSFIEPRQKLDKEEPLNAREFALFNAGIYDNEAIKVMPWGEYQPFVLKLFQVREHEHRIRGFRCDGYVGVHSVFVWNYPDQKRLTIDYDYVRSLHETLAGSAGDKFYVIAPIVSMGFAEDEYALGGMTYVFLKVPISILMRLLRSGEHGALKQPTNEADVNEVIDAVGFDFVSQPVVEVKCRKERAPDEPLLRQYAIHLTEFRSKTLATDPQDFANFETFSMAMVDVNYDGRTFKLSHVFWADTLIANEHKRLKAGRKPTRSSRREEAPSSAEADESLLTSAATEKPDLAACEQLSLRIAEEEFKGKRMMMIFCDRYGNEKTLVFGKRDFQ